MGQAICKLRQDITVFVTLGSHLQAVQKDQTFFLQVKTEIIMPSQDLKSQGLISLWP